MVKLTAIGLMVIGWIIIVATVGTEQGHIGINGSIVILAYLVSMLIIVSMLLYTNQSKSEWFTLG